MKYRCEKCKKLSIFLALKVISNESANMYFNFYHLFRLVQSSKNFTFIKITFYDY